MYMYLLNKTRLYIMLLPPLSDSLCTHTYTCSVDSQYINWEPAFFQASHRFLVKYCTVHSTHGVCTYACGSFRQVGARFVTVSIVTYMYMYKCTIYYP